MPDIFSPFTLLLSTVVSDEERSCTVEYLRARLHVLEYKENNKPLKSFRPSFRESDGVFTLAWSGTGTRDRDQVWYYTEPFTLHRDLEEWVV